MSLHNKYNKAKDNEKKQADSFHNNRGFTLMEFIVCMAIISIITVIIARYIVSSSIFFHKSKDEVDLDIQMQTIIDHLGDELKECESVDVTGPRYILRKSKERGILIVYDQEKETLYQRFLKVNTSLIRPEDNYQAECDQQIQDQANSGNDGDNTELSDDVVEFSMTEVGADKGYQKLYKIHLVLKIDDKTKECNKQIYLRN